MPATAMNNRRVLIDNTGPIQLTVNESAEEGGGKKLYAEGKIGHCGIATANGRIYSRNIMEREVGKLQPRIEQASLYSAVDHPGDGKSRIMNSGGIIRGLRIESDDSVWGKFEVVEETDCGRNLAALLRRGGTVGVSSRGLGSTSTNETGQEVVGEDFRLVSFDFVLDPAVQTAYPTFFSEDVDLEEVTEEHIRGKFPKIVAAIEENAREVASVTTYEAVRSDVELDVERALGESREQLREEFKAELYPEVVKELKEDFAVKLVRATSDIRREVEDVVRSEMAADPEVAGAKLTLENVAKLVSPFNPPPDTKKMIDEKDATIKELEKSIKAMESTINESTTAKDEADGHARNLAFQLHVERSIAGRQDAESIRGMVGDVSTVASAEELKSKVEHAIVAADKALEEAEARIKAESSVRDKINNKKAQLAERRAKKSEERDALLRDKLASLEEHLDSLKREHRDTVESIRDENSDLKRRLSRANKLAEQLETEAYAATRLSGHPHKVELMEGIRNGSIKGRRKLDELANNSDFSADEVGASERVRHFLGRGREFMPEEQRREREALTENLETPLPNLEDFDISVEEIRRLSRAGQRGR